MRGLIALIACLFVLTAPAHGMSMARTPLNAKPVPPRPAAKIESPQVALDGLLSADRTFAARAKDQPLPKALAAMIDAAGLVPAADAKFARGPAEAERWFSTNPLNLKSKVSWQPVRGGVSADGSHGFTFGAMTVTRESGATEPGKYLAYWVKRPAGWRVLAYARSRAKTPPPTAMLPPSLPARAVAKSASPPDRASLAAAEKAFSDLAQKIGLGPAFGSVAADDAVLISVDNGFVTGGREIQRQGFGPETTSPVEWSSDGTEVAASGDLGLSWGVVRPNPGAKGELFAFFTIWRRDTPGGPWRFIAE